MDIFSNEFARTFIFGVIVAVTLAVGVWIFMFILGEGKTEKVWKELKERNWPVAVVLTALVLSLAFVVTAFI